MNAKSQHQQPTATYEQDELRLVPPLAEEFSVHGGDDETAARCRGWALSRRYLLARGIPACAHGMVLMASCPHSTCHRHFRQLDHADVWVPADLAGSRPFLLSHPRSSEVSEKTRAYGEAHGLDVGSNLDLADDWYGHGTLPIRLAIPVNCPLWPIEAKALVMLATRPVSWPADGWAQ